MIIIKIPVFIRTHGSIEPRIFVASIFVVFLEHYPCLPFHIKAHHSSLCGSGYVCHKVGEGFVSNQNGWSKY